MTTTIVTIAKTKAWEFEFRLTHRSSGTGKEVPLTGATVRAWLSLTLGGDAVDDAHIVELAERTNKPGVYFGTLSVESVADDLSSLSEGASVYEVCERNGDIDSRSLKVVNVSLMTPI